MLFDFRDIILRLNGSHPNLLRLYGWILPDPDTVHVVMEKAEKNLLRALQQGLPLIIRINIALDVAEGLKAIHDIGYVYEDLKPGNILVGFSMCAIWDLVLNDGLCWRRKKNSNNHSSLYAIQASHKM